MSSVRTSMAYGNGSKGGDLKNSGTNSKLHETDIERPLGRDNWWSLFGRGIPPCGKPHGCASCDKHSKCEYVK